MLKISHCTAGSIEILENSLGRAYHHPKLLAKGCAPPALPPSEQPAVPISSLIHSTIRLHFAHRDARYHALDELEASGALLNLAIETNNVFGATDEDIYNCVMRGQKFEGARWTW